MKTGYESIGASGTRFMLNDVTNPIIRKLLSIQYNQMLLRKGSESQSAQGKRKKGRPSIKDSDSIY